MHYLQMSAAAYVWSPVCRSFDVPTAFITCLPPGKQKEPVFDVAPVFATSQGDCRPLLIINRASKVLLGGLVAIHNNLEAILSIIPDDTQRSSRQCVCEMAGPRTGGPGALHRLKALKLDYITNRLRLDEVRCD